MDLVRFQIKLFHVEPKKPAETPISIIILIIALESFSLRFFCLSLQSFLLFIRIIIRHKHTAFSQQTHHLPSKAPYITQEQKMQQSNATHKNPIFINPTIVIHIYPFSQNKSLPNKGITDKKRKKMSEDSGRR